MPEKMPEMRHERLTLAGKVTNKLSTWISLKIYERS